MPRFFVDTSDQEFFVRDEEGLECENLEGARNAAIAVLPDMAREGLPTNNSRTFSAIVRGEDGRTLFQASLHFQFTSLFPEHERP